MIQVNKGDLQEVLMLLMLNDCTSASSAGLKARQVNRKQAITELMFMLNMTSEEAEETFSSWLDKRV